VVVRVVDRSRIYPADVAGRSGSGAGSRGLVRPVAIFALTSAIAVAVIGVAVVVILQNSSRAEAERDALRTTEAYARAVVQPALTDAVLAMEPAALVEFAQQMGARIQDDRITRTKLWRADGTVVYSDEPRLQGQTFELDGGSLDVLENGGTETEIGTADGPENVFDASDEEVLEVYTQVRTPTGQNALFEIYVPYSAVQAAGSSIWWAFAPVVVGALLFLWLVQVPNAWGMARQIREAQDDRERLLRRALQASDAERRRIASDLHNGVVQTMAGTVFTLGGVEKLLPGDTPAEARGLLDDASTATRSSIRELRSLLVDIYPARLSQVGLEAAVKDLAAPLQAREVDVEVEVDLPEEPPETVAALIYRTAQEALHNVRDHSGAERVEVRLVAAGGGWTLDVDDDGRGLDDAAQALLDPAAPPTETGEHMGLRLLRELAEDEGGELSIGPSALGGVRVGLIIGAGNDSKGGRRGR
jgi:signal transduction histidine kinase